MLIFCICDLLAIGVQAIGGGMAAVALKKDSFSLTGTRIMVAGISLQLASMSKYYISLNLEVSLTREIFLC